jgi:hypothetical protein
VEPITASYKPGDPEWTVVVSGHGKMLTASAPNILAARDHADQLAATITPAGEDSIVVVHLLNGSALEFTRVYMTAQLAQTRIGGAAPIP